MHNKAILTSLLFAVANILVFADTPSNIDKGQIQEETTHILMAKYTIGLAFLNSSPQITPDIAKELIAQAFLGGLSDAQYFMGFCYFNAAYGYPEDQKKGEVLWITAVKNGNVQPIDRVKEMRTRELINRNDNPQRDAELARLLCVLYFERGEFCERQSNAAEAFESYKSCFSLSEDRNALKEYKNKSADKLKNYAGSVSGANKDFLIRKRIIRN